MKTSVFELIISRPISPSANVYRAVYNSLTKQPKLFDLNNFFKLSAIVACIRDGKFAEAGIYRITLKFKDKKILPTYNIRKLG
ncbi:hypothetical protein SEA_LIBERTYBELL_33 [Streptomyces phage LibertyBell]|nr:hypothetical protein SEA_LIBERTYBELL_33 [Streptomyces phage LibertyBell]